MGRIAAAAGLMPPLATHAISSIGQSKIETLLARPLPPGTRQQIDDAKTPPRAAPCNVHPMGLRERSQGELGFEGQLARRWYRSCP
jgi:hypothetical protein